MIGQHKSTDPVWSFRVNTPREPGALVNSKGAYSVEGRSAKDPGVVGKLCFLMVARIYPAAKKARLRHRILDQFFVQGSKVSAY